MNNRCVVIIPIYKEHLENYEILSLHRLYQVLGHKYDILYITYEDLDTLEYANIAYLYGYKSIERLHFPKGYFINTKEMERQGYNILFTDYNFYEKFLKYEYMFIYHLDCYIFKDDLEYWMNLNLPQIECIWTASVGNHIYFDYYNGEGLRNIIVFYDFLKDNQYKVYEWFYKYISPIITNTPPKYFNYNGCKPSYQGEDLFFTLNISHFQFPLNILDFGYNCTLSNYGNLLDEKLPLMIHTFQKNEKLKTIIGDWENNLQECIDCPNFVKLGY